MSTTQPIRNKEELQKFLSYYKVVQPNTRNDTLITLGLYTALRISDILHLKWEDVYNFEKRFFLEHLLLREQKTQKINTIALNPHAIQALEVYRSVREPKPSDYIFSKNTTPDIPLCRSQAYRIIKKAAMETLSETHISCHSLRKTFGYYAWKSGASPVLLMSIYNHSSFQITKRYLEIEQDDRDAIFIQTNFEG